MSLFGGNGGQQQRQQFNERAVRDDIAQIKAGPVAYLQQRGFNVPEGMVDAREITQYLLQSGQVGRGKLQSIVNMLGIR